MTIITQKKPTLQFSWSFGREWPTIWEYHSRHLDIFVGGRMTFGASIYHKTGWWQFDFGPIGILVTT